MGKRNKYALRADGRREAKVTYKDFGSARFSGVKHFYGKTDAEIDQKIRDFEKSQTLDPEEYMRTLSDIADAWWKEKEPKLSPNTVPGYKAKKNEIKRELGDIRARQLTPQDVYQWLSRVAAKGFSTKSITDRRSVLRNILDYAIREGEIAQNVVRDVPAVTGKAKQKRHPASDADVAKLESIKTESLMARMFYFIEYTGCRIGEASVLQEKDIDRKSHKAVINKDIAFVGSEPMIKPFPKSEAGEREIDLYDNVLEILPEYKDPETFIFFPDGLPRRKAWATAASGFLKDHGMSSTAHQYRHTYAGILHSAEIDVKDAQARLGHANIAVTQDIYTEIERKHNEKQRNKMNQYVMQERLGKKALKCLKCGNTDLFSKDGKPYPFCPQCGEKTASES